VKRQISAPARNKILADQLAASHSLSYLCSAEKVSLIKLRKNKQAYNIPTSLVIK
jgi:hypothetical protein